MYTNADLETSLCVRVDTKIITWKLYFLNPRILELLARKVCEKFVYKHTETMEYVKK